MFSRVLPKSLAKAFWHRGAVLTAGFPKVWANIPRLLVDPFVLDSRSFAPFRFTRAVSVGNPREFIQAEKEDQEMAEAYAAHQKLHHLRELSLPVAKVGRDRGCREPPGVSRCGGPRLGDFLTAHQPAGRV